jgi:hypothetical protein
VADVERTRRQGAPVLDRHRERSAVGDGDEHSDELDACRLRARFLGRRLVTPHCLAANPRLKKSETLAEPHRLNGGGEGGSRESDKAQ